MIAEDLFWSLVEDANRDFNGFCNKLNSMEKNELKEFVWMFKDKAEELGDDVYIDSILEDIESITEDELEDLSGWIVGKGKKYYTNVLNNPEKMPSSISDKAFGIEIQYEASQAYYKRFNEHIPQT